MSTEFTTTFTNMICRRLITNNLYMNTASLTHEFPIYMN